jgi:hypothetical protein
VSFDFAIALFIKCFIDFGGHRKNLMMLCDVSVFSFVLKVFEFLNSGGHQVHLLSCMLIVFIVKFFSYENLSFQHFFWCPPSWNVILFIFKLSKLIVSIFGLYQSPELIKYMLYHFNNHGLMGESTLQGGGGGKNVVTLYYFLGVSMFEFQPW